MRHILFILLIFSSVYSATYYFAATGNDSYTPIQAQNKLTPWQTLAKFNSFNFEPSDTVLFRRGDTFRGGIVLKTSENINQRITIGAYGTGPCPLIDGSVIIEGWKKFKGSIYIADYIGDKSMRIEQVFASGIPLKIARHPNHGYFSIDSVISSSSFISANLVGTTDWAGSSIHLRSERWSLDWRIISSFDRSSGKVVLNSNANYEIKKGWGFFVNSSLDALDQPGEWFYDSATSKLYVWMPNGSVPSNIEASVVAYGLYASSRNYITVENIKFAKHANSGIKINGSNNIISNCTVEFADLHGIEASVSNSTIRNCSIKYSNQTGIELNGANNKLIYDTVIGVAMINRLNRRGLGGYCCSGRGINSSGENNTISKCILDSIGYIGIGFSGQNNFIEKNVISRVCMTIDDGAGIYTWSESYDKPGSAGTVIRRNIVSDAIGAEDGTASKSGFALGIYIDDRIHNVIVDSNTSINNLIGIFLHNTRNVTVRGNICYANTSVQIRLQRDAIVKENDMWGNLIEANQCHSTAESQLGIDQVCYHPNDSALGIFRDNLIGIESPFRVEIRNEDGKLLWSKRRIEEEVIAIGPNKIANARFDSTVLAWGSWPSQYFELGIDSTRSQNGWCLRVRYFGDPAAGAPIFFCKNSFELQKGQWYRLRFSTAASHRGAMTVITRIAHPPWTTVGFGGIVELDTNWNTYERYFQSTVDDPQCRVDFYCSSTDTLIWLDDVSLHQVDSSKFSKDPASVILVNNSDQTRSFQLGAGTWRSMDNKSNIKHSFLLEPFHSIILFKDSVDNVVSNNQHASFVPSSIRIKQNYGTAISVHAVSPPKAINGIVALLDMQGRILKKSTAFVTNGFLTDYIHLKGLGHGIYYVKIEWIDSNSSIIGYVGDKYLHYHTK